MEPTKNTIASHDRELTLLYDLMAIAGRSNDVTDLLDQSLRHIVQALGCSMGIIHLVDDADDRLKVAANGNLYDSLKNYFEVSGVSSQLWEKVFREQQPLQISHLPDHRPFPEGLRVGWRFYSYIGVPIPIIGQTSGGVLSLFGDPDWALDPVAFQLAISAAGELGLAIVNARLHDQSREALVVAERQRLARNLHDSISQSLYTLVILADVSNKLVAIKDYPALRRQLADIVETSLHALKEMRLMLFDFRPSSLDKLGLVGALEERLNTVESRARIDVHLSTETCPSLSPQLEREIYQVAIEALNNALRHSGATRLDVELTQVDEVLKLTIADNGCGFELQRVIDAGGIGLTNMDDRARLLGGALDIRTAPGAGTCVALAVHLARSQEETGGSHAA